MWKQSNHEKVVTCSNEPTRKDHLNSFHESNNFGNFSHSQQVRFLQIADSHWEWNWIFHPVCLWQCPGISEWGRGCGESMLTMWEKKDCFVSLRNFEPQLVFIPCRLVVFLWCRCSLKPPLCQPCLSFLPSLTASWEWDIQTWPSMASLRCLTASCLNRSSRKRCSLSTTAGGPAEIINIILMKSLRHKNEYTLQ